MPEDDRLGDIEAADKQLVAASVPAAKLPRCCAAAGITMRACVVACSLALVSGCATSGSTHVADRRALLPSATQSPREIPVFVEGRAQPVVIPAGEPLPVMITVSNGLHASIYHVTFALEPNESNGETLNIELLDITRNGVYPCIHLFGPSIRPPRQISGPGAREIKPGQSLLIVTDARKWTVSGGWTPGHYSLRAAVRGLILDQHCTLDVTSDPFEFEIR